MLYYKILGPSLRFLKGGGLEGEEGDGEGGGLEGHLDWAEGRGVTLINYFLLISELGLVNKL